MAAYSTMVSLLQSLDDVSPRVHLSPQFESLREKVSFLLRSLESSLHIRSIHEIFEESLEAKIRDAVFKAQVLIEPKLVNLSIHELETNLLDEDLREIIQEIGYIVDEVKRIEDDHGAEGQPQPTRNLQVEVKRNKDGHGAEDQPQPATNIQNAAPSSSRGKVSVGSRKKLMLGFEKEVEEMRSKLCNNSLKLEMVPIVGMGGIGKTTLARCLYDDCNSDGQFDIYAWTTISQERSLRQALINLLDSGKMLTTEKMDGMREEDLALNLYQSLKDRRYLIVVDDVWDDDIWDVVQTYFPNDNNGSRVILTTRLSKVARHANPHGPLHQMSILDEEDSWNMLCNQVFRENDCPKELESLGKKIAGNCKGLLLAIAVTGGCLSKLSKTKEDWTTIADNLSQVVAKDDEQCMEILSLSYKHLPHHLRPCFLYMAMFPRRLQGLCHLYLTFMGCRGVSKTYK